MQDPNLRHLVLHLRWIRRLALLACTPVFASCARPKAPLRTPPIEPQPVTVARHVAYAHSADEVREAYRATIAGRGLRVEDDSAGGLRARTGQSDTVGLVRVMIGPSDTLTTRVSITYRYVYGGAEFYHYPYNLALFATKRLDRTKAVVNIPERVDPPSLPRCPPAPVDTTIPIIEPSYATGAGVVGLRTQYSEEARQAGIEGTVYLAALVSPKGAVECIEVLSGLAGGLTESAVSSLKRTRFDPALQRGRAIARHVIVPVRFILIE